MKLNFAITLLPAASAFNYLSSHHHHHHDKSLSTGVGTAPYGSGNRTATFGSSGLLTASTGTAGKAVYSTVVFTKPPPTQTIIESASASLNEAGTTLPFSSACSQLTVTVTEDATVTVTVSAPESGIPTQAPVPTASESGTPESVIPTQAPVPTAPESGTPESVIPTQAPVPTQAGTSATAAISSTPSVAVNSAITLAPIGAAPSSSASTPAVADTSATASASPVVVASPSTTAAVEPASTPATAPESTSEAATSPATAPATNPSKAAKRGIIVSGDDTDAITAAFANTKVSWLGNWYSGPPPNLTPEMGMSYVPQLYSPQYINDGSWASNAKKGVAAGDKYFMSFGEPDTSGMSPDTAVDLWMKNMEPYAAQGVKLGAPSNLQNPQDMAWLSKFLDLCKTAGCTIGFVGVHWFWTPGPNGQQDFKNAVGNATSLANGIPVWVDNFGATGGREGQIDFLKAIIPWLEDNDAIERYGYLAINRTQGGFLPETGDELSDLGQFYATF